MFFVQLLVRAAYCCDLSLESVGQRHGTNADGSHPGGAPVHSPHNRMRWLVSRAVLHEDGGQGDGCEGGKCAVRSRP